MVSVNYASVDKIWYLGGLQHIIIRGIERRVILRDDFYRENFLK
jgi:hypothetical protein